MLKIRKFEILSLILILIFITFLVGIIVYPYLPLEMSSHWGINNQVNNYIDRFWGVFLLPIIILICSLIFIIIPRADPRKENIEKFQKYYDLFVLTFILFFVYVYVLTIFWNLGYHFIFLQSLAPAFTFLFYVVGVMIEHAEPNFTIGFRTPWTLASDEVWYKTHKLGGKFFRVVALLALLGIVLPQYAIWFIIVPVILVSIYLFYYSYLEFKKIK